MEQVVILLTLHAATDRLRDAQYRLARVLWVTDHRF